MLWRNSDIYSELSSRISRPFRYWRNRLSRIGECASMELDQNVPSHGQVERRHNYCQPIKRGKYHVSTPRSLAPADHHLVPGHGTTAEAVTRRPAPEETKDGGRNRWTAGWPMGDRAH